MEGLQRTHLFFFPVLVVTGASQGIGKQYALQVSRHHNATLMLVVLASFIVLDFISFYIYFLLLLFDQMHS